MGVFCNINMRMAKFIFAGAVLFLVACGDDETTEYITNRTLESNIVSSVEDLPQCSKEIKGEQAFVKDESAIYVCYGKDWKVAGYYSKNNDITCLTESLKDSSGIKILCNGDSVGVVLNGHDGKKGKEGSTEDDGVGCSFVNNENSSVSIICGSDTLTYEVGASVSSDVVEMLKLQGASQKGPFLQGTKVYAYELENGRSLLQTSRSFVGSIQGNDGKFLIPSVSLKSPYILLEANGYFLNEVTGKQSTSPISLFALTDLLERDKANVNLLTHLEYYRVRHLVLEEKKNISKAREQAEREIFAAFNIDNSKFRSPEDLDIFSSGEDNAALLAISVMLEQDMTEGEMTNLLSELSSDFADDGKWNDTVQRMKVASWALHVDTARVKYYDVYSRLSDIRDNVEGWNLGDTVPQFETYMSVFWGVEFGLGVCGSDSVPIGTVKFVPQKRIKELYAKDYKDVSNSRTRFICENYPVRQWRLANDLEKDTYGFGGEDEEGTVRLGLVNKDSAYVHVGKGTWVHGIPLDAEIYSAGGKACCKATAGNAYEYDGESYVCYYVITAGVGGFGQWIEASHTSFPDMYYVNKSIEYDTLIDVRDGRKYRTVDIDGKTWMAENLRYANTETYGWNSVGDGDVCPENWHVASKEEWESLYAYAKTVKEDGVSALKCHLGWEVNGTDDFGFCARRKDPYLAPDLAREYYAFFWTSSESGSEEDSKQAVSFIIKEDEAYFMPLPKRNALAIRCVKD